MRSIKKKRVFKYFIGFVGIILLGIIFISLPNEAIFKPMDITVSKGESISSVADELYNSKLINSRLLFKTSAVLLSSNRGIQAGDYRFNYPQNTVAIARRMVNGDQMQTKVRVTIPEGTNVEDMAYIYLKSLSGFNAARFVSLAKRYEGYLYPDTYYFLENASPEEIIRTMRDNFDKKISTISEEIINFDKPMNEILTMASIVEKEAYADESRKIIAGILWKRLETGMLLQVDAPFYYLTAKRGNFTLEDLKIDSPYNTYLNKGLPPGPISNPSVETILDTVTPIKTDYWYYLTGNDGKMRYAADYETHLLNKRTYLR